MKSKKGRFTAGKVRRRGTFAKTTKAESNSSGALGETATNHAQLKKADDDNGNSDGVDGKELNELSELNELNDSELQKLHAAAFNKIVNCSLRMVNCSEI